MNFKGKNYILKESITSDYAFVKAMKGDIRKTYVQAYLEATVLKERKWSVHENSKRCFCAIKDHEIQKQYFFGNIFIQFFNLFIRNPPVPPIYQEKRNQNYAIIKKQQTSRKKWNSHSNFQLRFK